MTEAEWLECTKPEEMLTFVAWSMAEVAHRKARLFAVACCLRVALLVGKQPRGTRNGRTVCGRLGYP
jgi:hypothetical protein